MTTHAQEDVTLACDTGHLTDVSGRQIVQLLVMSCL